MIENKITPPSSTKNKNTNYRNPDEIRIMSLGGLGEVGKNCYVIEYKEGIYIVDFGILFPDKEQIGIDYIIPNYDYLKMNEGRIKGLFITHGHEDHIGGIPFLLRKVKIPKIYAPKTAKFMIENKLKEAKLKVDIREIHGSSEIQFPDLKIIVYRVTHSIPDAMGFFFETPDGNIVTTGDFKIDFSPPGQKVADFHKMVDLSKKGVMCMLSDSTNAHVKGISLSENEVGNNLHTLIKEAPGRIIFTTFASNLNRVQKIIEGALKENRKICVIGRSLINGIDIGMKTKYINITKNDLVEPKKLKNYKPEEICIITTGSQGENLAALSRISHGLNKNIALSEMDTIVFASSPIPGNKKKIGTVIDALYKTGCKVIINSDHFKTHASGHASAEEQKLLLTLFKPTNFAPIHGTNNMLLAHKKSAEFIGIPEKNIFLLRNGDLLSFKNKKGRIFKSRVPGKSIFVSGTNTNVPMEDKLMEKLASEGILIIVCLFDQKTRKLMAFPQITTRGFVVIKESGELFKQLQYDFMGHFKKNSHLPKDELIVVLNKLMISTILKLTGKSSYVSTELIDYKPEVV